MSDGIYSALSGAIAQQRALDVVANNVANVGTVGYRADHIAFREAVSRVPAGPNPDGLRYVAVSQMRTDSSDGPLTQTGSPLDMALQGDGFFSVQTENGTRYTRAGSFRRDAQGVVRSPGGHPVLAETGTPLVIPVTTTDLTVAPDGTISADGQAFGRFMVRRFEPGQLAKEGLTMYVAQGPGQPATDAQILQGHLEGANVSPIAGMNELITASRAFDAFQRVIQAFRQIDERAARDVAGR